MISRRTRPRAGFIVALSLAIAVIARADTKLDLDRITPVPADQPIPVQDFFRPAMLRDTALNDSGTHLAALATDASSKVSLLVIDLDKPADKPLVLNLAYDIDVHRFAWLNDTRLIFSTSTQRSNGTGAYVADVGKGLNSYAAIEGARLAFVGAPDARRTQPLFHVLSDIAGTGAGEGRKGLVIEVNTDLPVNASLGSVDERNDRHISRTYPDSGAALETGYLTDKAGELAFALTTRDGVSQLHRFAGDSWKECPVNLDEIDVVSYGSRPGELIVRGPHRTDKPRALQFMDAATGELGEPILEDGGYDFYGQIIRDPRTHQILGLSFHRTVPAVVWFSEEYSAVQKFLEANFPGKVVRTGAADHTGKNFVMQVYSDRQPVTTYRANLETRQFAQINNSAPWIDPGRMRPMTMMKFKTTEGRQLDAYVTLPAGASKEKPAPLVVLPHDGPQMRDTWGYNGTVQYLASRGYAVLQPNYRGSDGTCWMFPYADRWAYRKMHDDVTAATRAVLKTGLIDRDRVAIMGTGFGGYLAVSGVVNEPSLYRCAVTIAGVFDWADRIQNLHINRFNDPTYGTLVRWLGEPAANREKFDAFSPGRFIERVQVPVFVAYDKDDSATITSESRGLVASLRKFDKAHEVVVTAKEGHGTREVRETVELYRQIGEFLASNLAARPAPKAAP